MVETQSAIPDPKSETVSELQLVTDLPVTIEQALDLSTPTLAEGVDAAREYISRIHPVITKAKIDLTELIVRIGTVLLEYRNSEYGAYGKWGKFLEKNFPLSERTARNYMAVALETTPEQRDGKSITEIYEEIGVVTRPGEKARSQFLARLEKVEGYTDSCIESIHSISTRFGDAIEPYDGSNRDIGGFIALSCQELLKQLDTCIAAANTAKTSVAMLATSKAPDGGRFLEEEFDDDRQTTDASLWPNLPDGTVENGTNISSLPCCEKESIMAGLGRSEGKCRECGKKVAMKGRRR